MDRYQKVEKPRPEEPIKENEIRVTAQGLIRNYISYATTLLQVILYDLFVLFCFISYVCLLALSVFSCGVVKRFHLDDVLVWFWGGCLL